VPVSFTREIWKKEAPEKENCPEKGGTTRLHSLIIYIAENSYLPRKYIFKLIPKKVHLHV
jgi:hypothetical protein